MAQSDFPLSDDFPQVRKLRDHKLTRIVQRRQALIPSRPQCDFSSNSTTTTTPTTTPPIQQRNIIVLVTQQIVPAWAYPQIVHATTPTTTPITKNSSTLSTIPKICTNVPRSVAPNGFFIPNQIPRKCRNRRITKWRNIEIWCDVNTSCPLIFSPLIEPETPPVDSCNSLQVPQSGGHKYGTLYFSLRLLELMIELEMIGVSSQLVFNEYNGLALLWFIGSHRDT